MIETVALAMVVAAGLYLVALGGWALLAPSGAGRFLLGFAGTPAKHYSELALRFLLGGAFVVAAPRLPFPGWFSLFGWVLLGTTLGLALVPWRWHHRFTQRAVPEALRYLPLVGICSAALGLVVLWAAWRGAAA